MRRRNVFAQVAVAVIVILLAGCKSLPPDEVRTGISLLSEGINDYVGHEQPLIEARIQALRDRLEVTEDEEERQAIEALIGEEEQYFQLGEEIPPTLKELRDWAEGTPLPDEEEGP